MKITIFCLGVFCLLGMVTEAAAIDLKPGMWEHTVSIDMPGLPFTPPSVTTRSCMSPADAVPGSAGGGRQNCSEPEVQVHGNTVKWKITCSSKAGTSVSEGTVTYSTTSYQGESTSTTQSGMMHSKMSGEYVGTCN